MGRTRRILEEQALGPIQAGVEMAMPIDELLTRLKGFKEYVTLFQAAFPGEGITPEEYRQGDLDL